MTKKNHTPATNSELSREAGQWDSRMKNPKEWSDAPEATPRVAASTPISLRVPAQMLEVLRGFAQREGIGYQVLMKRWLDERIRHEREQLMARQMPRTK